MNHFAGYAKSGAPMDLMTVRVETLGPDGNIKDDIRLYPHGVMPAPLVPDVIGFFASPDEVVYYRSPNMPRGIC